MSNLGFHRALEALGVETVVTDVGDRYVLAEMREHSGAILGGEQSGHVIALDRQTTGDGLITATMLLDGAGRAPTSRSRTRPRHRGQVPAAARQRARGSPPAARRTAVWEAVRAARSALGADGRIVLRASGTEPLVRVMVETTTVKSCVARPLR